MKFKNVLVLIIVSVICFSSCSNKFYSGFITKRKYNKGFYISHKKNTTSTNEKQNSKFSTCKNAAKNSTLNDTTPVSTIQVSTKNNSKELNKDFMNIESVSSSESETLSKINLKSNSKTHCNSTNQRKSISKSVAIHFETKKNKMFGMSANSDWNATLDAIQLFFIVLLFILFTIIYTVGIISSSPGFPLVFAVPIAMLMAIVSIVTGIYFY